MPIYETEASVRGEIRVTGDIEDLELIETLQAEFGRYQPGVHFKNQPARAGVDPRWRLYRHRRSGFPWPARFVSRWNEWRLSGQSSRNPTRSSLQTRDLKSIAPGHSLQSLYMVKIPSTCSPSLNWTRFLVRNTNEGRRTFALGAKWARTENGGNVRFIVFAPELDSLSALFFRRLVMKDSRKWNLGLVEFSSPDEALRALSKDPSGIAFAPLAYQHPDVKALAILTPDRDVEVALTRATAIAQAYPLHRSVSPGIAQARPRTAGSETERIPTLRAEQTRTGNHRPKRHLSAAQRLGGTERASKAEAMRLLLTLVTILLAVMPVLAEGPVPVPAEGPLLPYEPSGQVDGTIRIWGHGAYGKRLAFVEGLVGHWEGSFPQASAGH